MNHIKEILSKYKKIAMVGVSNDPTKASTIVMKYMQKYGFKVYPVNPKAKGQKILGEDVCGKITDIKDEVDIVNVFRPSKEALDIAKDAINIKAKVLWLQLGIKNEQAKKLVTKNNIEYIEDRCTKMEYQKHFLKIRQAFPVLQD
jgi:predicted CoA-binding protein|tara:strand:+ start:836 stop:1270 length:435 start_codon:yes stop_codon:yes gene_type:complete